MEPNNGGGRDAIEVKPPIVDNIDRKQGGGGELVVAKAAVAAVPQQASNTESTTTIPIAETTKVSAFALQDTKMDLSTSASTPPPIDTTTPMAVDTLVDNGKNPKSPSTKDLRRKNRRRLHRLLKKPGAQPSFLRIIEERTTIVKKEPDGNSDEIVVIADESDDEEEDFLLEPPKVVIDVDEYLGLKQREKFSEAVLSASLIPSSIVSSTVRPFATTSSTSIPNGWFEGSCKMAMDPEDSLYLTENQQVIRKNMEFFTATKDDLAAISNRKSPVVVGRVGFRCLHCAKALRSGEIYRMPAASVSFPKNFAALYNLTIQKQQMHIDDCPYVPPDMKWSKEGAKSRKRKRNTIPALVYWQIACRRLGIVEVEKDGGLRFERDPTLEPLPFETVQEMVEQEHPGLMPKNRPMIERAGPLAVFSSASLGAARTTTSAAAMTALTDSLPKAISDVLKEAHNEKEDLTIQLLSKEDATILSGFMFLTIQQATYCHAIAEDFATRGKKTRLMRLGYAGFCCRHCKRNYHMGGSLNVRIFQNSCRSFSSSRDNVGSAMSNSFVLHLMKCDYTPQSVKNAMQYLKKLHSKQMHSLPYGSQSSVFAHIWQRIRASDKPKENGVPDRPIMSPTIKKETSVDDDEYLPDAIGSTGMNRKSPNKSRRYHPISLPPIDDNESREVLKDAEENWDPSQNDNLIQRQDRGLISDFVFLCMRQLKVAIPTGADFRLNRPRRMAGLCCLHCSGAQSNSRGMSSGRSFPSAPDNIASILNATIYKHLMNCPHVPLKLKRTIDAVKKSHTKQCSSLPYGAQRRYFEKLFERLKNVPMEGVLANTRNETIILNRNETTISNDSDYWKKLDRCEFVQTKSLDGTVYYQCRKCRMVPYDYRATGSILLSTPSVVAMEEHRKVCKKDGMCWDTILFAWKKLNLMHGGVDQLITPKSFTNLIRSVVGDEPGVCDTFMAVLRYNSEEPPSSDIWRRLAPRVDFDRVKECFAILLKDIKFKHLDLFDTPSFLEFFQLINYNFDPPTKPPPKPPTPEDRALMAAVMDRLGKKKKSSYENSFVATNAALDKSATTSFSAETSQSEATIQDPQLQLKNDREVIIIPEPIQNEELSKNQGLTWDQGINVMDNIEAGQFDDA